jgi:hypothetical protein
MSCEEQKMKIQHYELQPFLYEGEELNRQMLTHDDSELNSLRKNHGDKPAFWEKRFDTLAQLLEFFNKQEGLVFRGQANADWRLDSSLVRLMKDCGFPDDSEFGVPNIAGVHQNIMRDILSVIPRRQEGLSMWQERVFMQHYGFPTRLLDWTDSLDNALFFAFENVPAGSTHAAVYSVDVGKVYIQRYGNFGEKDKIFVRAGDTCADDVLKWLKGQWVDPDHDDWVFTRPKAFWDFRMAVQETVLSSQADMVSFEKIVADTTFPFLPSTLVKILLPVSMLREVDEYLKRKGISRQTLFPNMDERCAQAKRDLTKQILEFVKKS